MEPTKIQNNINSDNRITTGPTFYLKEWKMPKKCFLNIYENNEPESIEKTKFREKLRNIKTKK